MIFTVKKFKFTEYKELLKELEFTVACEKVSGNELLIIEEEGNLNGAKFVQSALRALKLMKRDGVIKLFVKASEILNPEKMEGVYLLNKFPQIAEADNSSETKIYIKL